VQVVEEAHAHDDVEAVVREGEARDGALHEPGRAFWITVSEPPWSAQPP